MTLTTLNYNARHAQAKAQAANPLWPSVKTNLRPCQAALSTVSRHFFESFRRKVAPKVAQLIIPLILYSIVLIDGGN